MSDFAVARLFDSGTLAVRDVLCGGQCRHRSQEECASSTHLVFPYRGLYLRHVGQDQSVADANHALLFNAGEGYQVSHPVAGGDASLVIALSEPLLRELAPAELLQKRDQLGFRLQSLRIDARAQALVALLRHNLQLGRIETLEAESLALTLVCRSLGPRTTHITAATHARRRLVDRVKVLLAADLTRRWTLEEIAAEIGGSAVYLTQAFQQVEGLPLYRYHLRLRLARALDRIPHSQDMSALALDLGFSSHSHFTAAFKQAYGRTPSAFQRSALAKSA
ncbi:AraC family transcriptional regulator [Lysobacter sp. Root916]|uniref:helix-turn-helix transcriptional regulator n=1 Tax=Lysobacter sp. Root916 TaxID=1736606 RepID=UPI00070D9B4B|nr:AraC family transcriptional regulator [Lysobacter sp. Root916]KRD34871.1 AraC family transcriptional regulator [Lysobacter sp. Root916]